MTSQQIICAASSSSSSSLVSSKNNDVFLSFRGEDTRRTFISHLYEALVRKNLKTFIDDNELQKGDDISPSLTKAIEESYISIVIFSKHYASSKWCLNELIKILECKNSWGQIVIPVFYYIDPSHVRKQTDSYQEAFAKHEVNMKLNKDILQKWKYALFEASNLVGFDSSKYKDDAVLLKDIVEDVLRKLKPRYPIIFKERGLVGIEQKYEEMISLLEMESNDVRSIGVWGMGGSGKTTLVEVLFDELFSQFEGYCFLKNVREESQRRGLDALGKILFSALLEEENLPSQLIERRLEGKKLLIVLDDVATSNQMDCLTKHNNVLGQGSRVLVTTRNKQIIKHFFAIYEINELNECDSLEFFCLKAFREKHPKIGYEELSKSAIIYCKGNPLALKVLGARLSFRSKMEWKSNIRKLQKIPDEEIHSVLKSSYDDLDPAQKDIFLDLACFFKDMNIKTVKSVLEACGFYPDIELEVLKDLALITIDRFNDIKMHDLIQEMGRKIVNQIKELGERSRLWKWEEVADLLKNNMGTKAVEGIRLYTYELGEDLSLRSDCFKMMTNLRYLKIESSRYHVYLPDGLEWLSDKLRYLEWDEFPLNSLPSTFCANMLVELHMKHSKLKKLWDGVQNLFNLKRIDLNHSKDLIEMPDLSRATNLEIVNLLCCSSLCELHPSVLSLPNLNKLYLEGCTNIKSLKSNIHSESLSRLDLGGNSSLMEFSVTSEEMTYLSLSCTAIRELPSSISRNRKLKDLDLSGCKELSIVGKKLSNDPGIVYLEYLGLSRCIKMNALNLSFLLDGIQSLKRLYLNDCCNLETLPHNIHKHTELQTLLLDGCINLVLSSPTVLLPPSLKILSAINCTLLDTDRNQRLWLDNMLQSILLNRCEKNLLFMPGEQVPDRFGDQGVNSITIPHISKSNLKGFLLCLLVSKSNLKGLKCYICEQGEEVENIDISEDFNFNETLISDHVLVFWCNKEIQGFGTSEYNIEFKFEYLREEEWVTDGIEGCGVLPVYELESEASDVDEFESSDVDEFEASDVELESQACDVDEFEARSMSNKEDVDNLIEKFQACHID